MTQIIFNVYGLKGLLKKVVIHCDKIEVVTIKDKVCGEKMTQVASGWSDKNQGRE